MLGSTVRRGFLDVLSALRPINRCPDRSRHHMSAKDVRRTRRPLVRSVLLATALAAVAAVAVPSGAASAGEAAAGYQVPLYASSGVGTTSVVPAASYVGPLGSGRQHHGDLHRLQRRGEGLLPAGGQHLEEPAQLRRDGEDRRQLHQPGQPEHPRLGRSDHGAPQLRGRAEAERLVRRGSRQQAGRIGPQRCRDGRDPGQLQQLLLELALRLRRPTGEQVRLRDGRAPRDRPRPRVCSRASTSRAARSAGTRSVETSR